MPVRFQVDPDFYDHPKTIGMSDAATALWVRAGSYSAAKLSDGFIAEHVLALLSRTPEEAADELVRRGLWKRCRGGFKFHQWSPRNLTRARVEADQERERERKRRDRAANAKKPERNRNPQASPGIVRAESDPTPDGIQAESDQSPSVSMSVSVSESVSKSSSTRRTAREDDDDQTQRIDQKITDLLQELTGRTVPPEWAARVRRQLLDGRDVDKPIAYITRALRERPRDYLPPSTPPAKPVPPLPPLGERDNTATNSRGRQLVEQALGRRAPAPDGEA
ncbi:hypothetical protein AB0J37_01935 [Microbispora rosea]|uniref:hypothetical protein n=1 Tax=Microbispora rosea TaxID=58117 RepID=UPI00341C62A8